MAAYIYRNTMSESLRFLILTLIFINTVRLGNSYLFNLDKQPIELNQWEIIDTESCFASGGLIPFLDSELFDLELISGISESTANSIIEHRSDIIKRALNLSVDQRYRAFEVAKGIGPKKAVILGEKFHLLNDQEGTNARCLPPEYAR